MEPKHKQSLFETISVLAIMGVVQIETHGRLSAPAIFIDAALVAIALLSMYARRTSKNRPDPAADVMYAAKVTFVVGLVFIEFGVAAALVFASLGDAASKVAGIIVAFISVPIGCMMLFYATRRLLNGRKRGDSTSREK